MKYVGILLTNDRKEVIKILKKNNETVMIAKGEVIYAFQKGMFANMTTEQVMEEIKKDPKGYSYYKVGPIKITEIKEIK